MSEPWTGLFHQQFCLDLETILFVGFHGPAHGPEDGLGWVRVPARVPQRPNEDPLQAKTLVSVRYALFGVRQFCVHRVHVRTMGAP
jgi:hypothetical protein